MQKIDIRTDDLRIRSTPSLKGNFVKYATRGTHEYVCIKEADGYKWYNIEEGWVAGVSGYVVEVDEWEQPESVEPNKSVAQVFVGDFTLNIRDDASTSATRKGSCKRNSYYNVLDKEKSSSYTWYKIGEKAWIAGVEGVIFYEKDAPRITADLTKELEDLVVACHMALSTIKNGQSTEKYEELYEKINNLPEWIQENFDNLDYDYVDKRSVNNIDLIYTTDIHGYFKGYEESQRVVTNFSMNDLTKLKTKLENQGDGVLLVNCGDIINGSSAAAKDYGQRMIDEFNKAGFFTTVFGNHEFRYNKYGKIFQKQAPKINSMTACNLIYKDTGKLVFKPYRIAKLGTTRIGIIGCGFPGLEGNDLDEYDVLTDDRLYAQVNKYVKELRSMDVDYVFLCIHHGKEPDARSGGLMTIQSLIANTTGIDLLLPGHSHEFNQQEYFKNKSGQYVPVAAQPRCDLNYVSQVTIKPYGTITSKLLTNI